MYKQRFSWLLTIALFLGAFQTIMVPEVANAGSVNFLTGGTVTIPYSDKFDPGTGAFTLEMWVKETAVRPAQYTAQFFRGTKMFNWDDRVNKSSWGLGVSFDGENLYLAPEVGKWPTPAVLTAGTNNGKADAQTSNTKTVKQVYETFTDQAWHHIAVSKSGVGGALSTYLDGIRVIYAPNDSNNFIMSGGDVLIGGGKFVGQIGDVRLIKGQGLYAGPSITVPTSKITTTSQGAIASNVSLLLQAGGGNCAIEDFSDNHFSVLINGASCNNLVSRPLTSYNLQFNNQGHGATPADIGNINSIAVGSLPVISNDGYFTFQGWAATAGGQVLTGTYTAAADSTLFAIWQDETPGMRSTTYNLGGGTGTLPTQATVSEGTSYSLASSSGISRAGYTFNKWNDGTADYAAGASYTVSTTNVTLTATWTANPTHTITYNLGGGSGTLPTQAAISEGASFSTASSSGLTRAGYTFNKWNDGSTNYSAGVGYIMSTSNVTLTATWTTNPTHTTTYNLGGGSGTLPTQAAISEGASFNTASSSGLTRVGYTFDKWNDGSADYATGASYTMSTSNVTLTATWTAKSTSRTIVFPTTSYTLNYGDTQTVTASVSARANIPTITFNGNANTNTNPGLTTGINGNQGVNGNFFGYSVNQGSFTEGQIVTMSDLRAGSTITYSGKLHFVFAGGFGWAFYITDILSVTGSSVNSTSTNWLLTGEGAITYSAGASTACSVDRWTGQVSITSGTGTCEISSTVVEDSEYQAMTTTVPISITVNKIAQSALSLSLSASSKSTPYTQALTLTPSGGTGSGTTTYAIAAGGTASGCSLANSSSINTISATSAGTCLIQATKSADSNYSATTSSTQTFTFNTSNQASALVLTSTSGTYGTDLNLTTSGGSGSGAVSFATSTAGCSLPTSNTLRATGPITCQVTATKAADVDYNATSSVLTNVIFSARQLTITGLVGINKEFDGLIASSASGSPSLSGIVDGDVVTLLGVPSFTFATSSAANSKLVSTSGYSLTGTDSSKYTLTQPTFVANITKKSVTVTATSSTVAVGSPYTPTFTFSGLVGSDSITAVTYSFSSTGTGTPPTAISSSVITPSAAIFGVLGAGENYNLSYVTGTLNIVSSFQVLFKSNFTSSDTSTVTVNFVPGDVPITPLIPTRNNFTFMGWYTLAVGGSKINSPITPTADVSYWAHWIQNSLNGMGNANKIGTFTTDSQYLDTFTRSGDYGTVTVSIPAGALPHQTLVDIYQVTDPSRANSLLAGSNYVLSLVVAWLASDATVPTTQSGKPVTMTISNATIKKGAKIYAIVNDAVTLLGTAAQDGTAQVLITDDPEVVVVLTKPDAPTSVSATSGGNASTTVSWVAPSDGGSAITSYTATSNAGQSCTSTRTTCSITGLTNGTPYTFTVTATNLIGTSGTSSASSPITPTAPAPAPTPPSGGGGGGGVYIPPTPDPAIALAEAAKKKAEAEKAELEAKAAAELKASQDRAAAEAAQTAALRAAQEIADAQAKAAAELKAAQDKAEEDSRIAEELRMAREKAESELRAAAEKKAAEDAAAAALLAAKKIVPNVTLYSISTSLKLSVYDNAYLKKYVSKLKANAKVTCVGYIYTKNTTYAKAKVLASKQAKAVCALIKSQKKTIATNTILYPASKAPKAAAGAKWVAVSYRVDGYKS